LGICVGTGFWESVLGVYFGNGDETEGIIDFL
jgi:hypothetical protein